MPSLFGSLYSLASNALRGNGYQRVDNPGNPGYVNYILDAGDQAFMSRGNSPSLYESWGGSPLVSLPSGLANMGDPWAGLGVRAGTTGLLTGLQSGNPLAGAAAGLASFVSGLPGTISQKKAQREKAEHQQKHIEQEALLQSATIKSLSNEALIKNLNERLDEIKKEQEKAAETVQESTPTGSLSAITPTSLYERTTEETSQYRRSRGRSQVRSGDLARASLRLSPRSIIGSRAASIYD